MKKRIKKRTILLYLILLVVSIHIYLINTRLKASESSFEEYTSNMVATINLREVIVHDSPTLDYIDLYAGVIEENGVEKLIYFYHFIEEDKGIGNSIYLKATDCQSDNHDLIRISNRKEAIGEFDIQTIQKQCGDSESLTMWLLYSIKTHFLHQYSSSSFIELPNLTIEDVKGKN
jgi:hypothetical protein